MKIQVRIDAVRDVASGVRAFELVAIDGGPLPSWRPGAHLQVLMTLEDGSTSRAYSLCGEPDDRGRYVIAVQREDAGGGGSRHMHGALKSGDRIVVSAPANAFPFEPGGRPVELVAGGIGATPILAMAREAVATAVPFRLTLFARSRAAVPFLDETRALAGDALTLVTGKDLEKSRRAIGKIAARAAATDASVYFCGPDGFAAALREACRAAGLDEARLRSERFVNPTQFDAGRPFDIRLASTGETCRVPAGVSALDALAGAFGLELPSDCRAGYCGTCVQKVAAGIPEHRDTSLGFEEKQANGVMCLCVSRALTPEIVLEI